MKLIKIKEDHYIVVDDSEVRPGDYVYTSVTSKTVRFTDPRHFSDDTYWKVTHSTEPLDKSLFFTDRIWGCERLSLGEVKELVGEKSWKGYIDGTGWEVELVGGKLKLK